MNPWLCKSIAGIQNNDEENSSPIDIWWLLGIIIVDGFEKKGIPDSNAKSLPTIGSFFISSFVSVSVLFWLSPILMVLTVILLRAALCRGKIGVIGNNSY